MQDDSDIARQVATQIIDFFAKHPPLPRTWLNHKEAAAYLRTSVRKLDEYTADGTLQPRFIGNSRRYRIEQLDALARERAA